MQIDLYYQMPTGVSPHFKVTETEAIQWKEYDAVIEPVMILVQNTHKARRNAVITAAEIIQKEFGDNYPILQISDIRWLHWPVRIMGGSPSENVYDYDLDAFGHRSNDSAQNLWIDFVSRKPYTQELWDANKVTWLDAKPVESTPPAAITPNKGSGFTIICSQCGNQTHIE